MQNERVDSEWVVTLAVFGALFVGVAGSIKRAAQRGAVWQRRVEARWREAAELLGGTLGASSSGALSPRRLALAVDADDGQAVAEVNVPVDPGAPSHTRARARFALGRGPVFRVRDRGVAEPFGGERALLADRALARRVRIDSEHAAATAALFSGAASMHAAAFTRPISLRSDGETIELVWDGVELDVDVLASAVHLVAELARSGTAVLRTFAELDGATYVPVREGGPLLRVRRDQAEVELIAEPGPVGPVYVAHTTSRRPVPAFSVHIAGDGTVEGELPPGLVDPESAPSLATVGESLLEGDATRIELEWDATPTREQAEAAVRLLSAIAAGTGRQGAFR